MAATPGTSISELFDAEAWAPVTGFELTDITYHRAVDAGVVRVAFDRPEVRNAFRPHTVDELYRALDDARQSPDVGCVLTGNGPSPRDGGWAFCSGGDQRIRGKDGYQYSESEDAEGVDAARTGRLHILEVQRLIRFMPKVVIAVVPGWAAGGGHSLHVVCDLTIASREHARFKQTDLDVASVDGGFGSAYLARQVGQKFAREVFLLAEEYSAEDACRMGMVNRVVDHGDLPPRARRCCRRRGGGAAGSSPRFDRGSTADLLGRGAAPDDLHQELEAELVGQLGDPERGCRLRRRSGGCRVGSPSARACSCTEPPRDETVIGRPR